MKYSGPISGLISFSIGGGWGSEVAKDGYSRVAIIRGTDIPKVAAGDFSTIPYRFESDKKLANRYLAAGDVVLETAGGSSANGQYTGRTALITDEVLDALGPTICASFCKKLVLDKDLVNPTYFYYYMQDLYKSGRVASYDSQSTGISNFQFENFINNEVLDLPTYPHQIVIGNVLASLQAKMNINSQIARTLEKIAQTIFKSWFVDFDPVYAKARGEQSVVMDADTAAVFPDSFEDSELGPVPAGWGLNSMATNFQLISGGTPKTTNSDFWDGDIPWYSVVDVPYDSPFFVATSKYITKLGVEKSAVNLIGEGTTIISARGTVGKLAMAGVKAAFNQSCYGIKGKLTDYFTYLLVQNSVKRLQAMTHGGTFDTITRTTFDAIDVVTVPESVQIAFEELVQPLFEQMKLISHQNVTLAQCRDSLLPRLISGELEIPAELLEA